MLNLRQMFQKNIFYLKVIGLAIVFHACKHETQLLLTAPNVGIPCNSDTVYFQNQILPLLVSTCGMSTCHNAQFHTLGYDLTNYEGISKLVVSKKPTASALYLVITATDPTDKMPIQPAPIWSPAQEALLKRWIEQGALNNVCNEAYMGCDTTNITYTNFIQPIIKTNCQGCHIQKAWGGNILLNTFDEVKQVAQSGQLYESITWKTGLSAMPKFQKQLPDCYIQKVEAWIKKGCPY
jgi:hypothetical protein